MFGRTKRAEPACSFCGKQQPAVKLVAGPLFTICSECVARFADIAPEGAACSFCGVSGPTLICPRCLAICRDMVGGSRSSA